MESQSLCMECHQSLDENVESQSIMHRIMIIIHQSSINGGTFPFPALDDICRPADRDFAVHTVLELAHAVGTSTCTLSCSFTWYFQHLASRYAVPSKEK